MSSPTTRSLERMRKLGYLCQVVERWNQHAHIRQDLFGFIDILCIHETTGHVVALQACSYCDVMKRVDKIRGLPAHQTVLTAKWSILVQGWRKTPKIRGGKQMVWTCREFEVQVQHPQPKSETPSESLEAQRFLEENCLASMSG